jgi:outer membrane protein TolC
MSTIPSSAVVRGLAGLLLAAAPCAAQPVAPESDDPVLAALVAEVLERSPELRAAEAELAAARAESAQARALPDPMVSATWVNDGWSPSVGRRDMTTLGLMWSQELPGPGKRDLAGRRAELEAAQVEQQVEIARRDLRAEAQLAYAAWLLGRERLELVREQRETWKQMEGVTRARYAVGQGAQQDVLRVQVEVTRIEQLHARQSAQVEVDLAEINRLRDRAPDEPLSQAARLRLVGEREAPEALVERLRAHSPELRAGLLTVEREQAGLRLAEKQRQPDFSVQAGYMHRGALDPMWQAGLGVRLPLRRAAQRAAVTQAEARRSAAQRRVEALGLRLRARTHQRLAQLRALERQAQLYEDGIVPQDRMSVESAIANYQAGKVPFLSVLEALTTLYADRAMHLELLAEHAATRVTMHAARLDAESMQAEE